MSIKQPKRDNRDIGVSKLLYVACLMMIGSFVVLFGSLSRKEFIARYGVSMSATDLNSTIIFFACISVLSLVGGYCLSRFVLKSSLERKWFLTSLIRVGSFMPLTAGGIVVGYLGADWLIVMLFFLISAAALIVTFPTKGRWGKTL